MSLDGLLPRSYVCALAVFLLACGEEATWEEPGLRVERAPIPTGTGFPDPTATLVYVDPSQFELGLFTAVEHGGQRTPERWAEEFELAVAINAAMYLPNLRSTAFMVNGAETINGADHPAYGGFLAFDPVDPSHPALVAQGRDCPGFDLEQLRRDYRVVFANYRLLDCNGDAMDWRDPKLYSATALALDRNGWLVLIHSGGPCRMSDFSRWLSGRQDLTAAVFTEGGPPAGLYARVAGHALRRIGAYQGVPAASRFREVPNVLGARRR